MRLYKSFPRLFLSYIVSLSQEATQCVGEIGQQTCKCLLVVFKVRLELFMEKRFHFRRFSKCLLKLIMTQRWPGQDRVRLCSVSEAPNVTYL